MPTGQGSKQKIKQVHITNYRMYVRFVNYTSKITVYLRVNI